MSSRAKPIFYLCFLLPLLSACSHDDPNPADPPAPTVTLHITADNPGIAPSYAVIAYAYRIRQGKVLENYGPISYKQDQVNDTRVIIPALDPAYMQDSLQVAVALPGPYIGYSVTGFAQVDVLVNGQVRKSARVDASTPWSKNPYTISQPSYLALRNL